MNIKLLAFLLTLSQRAFTTFIPIVDIYCDMLSFGKLGIIIKDIQPKKTLDLILTKHLLFLFLLFFILFHCHELAEND